MDDDLETLSREELVHEVRKLRAGIRAHRDSSGHDLCWHHPQLWGLLPERVVPEVAVPPWPSSCADACATASHWIASCPMPQSPMLSSNSAQACVA